MKNRVGKAEAAAYTFVNTTPEIKILSGAVLVPRFITLDPFNTFL